VITASSGSVRTRISGSRGDRRRLGLRIDRWVGGRLGLRGRPGGRDVRPASVRGIGLASVAGQDGHEEPRDEQHDDRRERDEEARAAAGQAERLVRLLARRGPARRGGPAQGEERGFGVGEALRRVRRHELPDDLAERLGELGSPGSGVRRPLLGGGELRRDDLGDGPRERRRPDGHLVEHAAERVEVRAAVGRLLPDDLGRDVPGRSRDRPHRRSRRGVGEHPRQAEVGHPGAAGPVEEDVRRLDVPVEDLVPVGVREGAQDAEADLAALGLGEAGLPLQPLPQRAAGRVLHDEQVRVAEGLEPVEDDDPRRLAELRGEARLAPDLLEGVLVRGELRR
jgi:hypothetical protein